MMVGLLFFIAFNITFIHLYFWQHSISMDYGFCGDFYFYSDVAFTS